MDLPSISLVGIKRKSSVHDGLEERQDKKGLFIHNDKVYSNNTHCPTYLILLA